MILPIHLLFKYILYIILGMLIEVTLTDLILIFAVSLFDIDHLFSKPIYKSKRNPFKTHFLHKQWRIVIIIALALLFIRPVLFVGIGLLSHLFMDYLYVKWIVERRN